MQKYLLFSLLIVSLHLMSVSSLNALTLSTTFYEDSEVYINGEKLAEETIDYLEKTYRIKILDGRYWYDAMSGAWGYEGGPTKGIGVAGLNLGGALSSQASNGNTGVFINNREIHQEDLNALQALLGPIQVGRYWMDSQGNAGSEGGAALVNVWQVARQSQAQSKSWIYRNWYTGIGGGSDGETTYFIGKDFYYIK